MSQQVHIVVHLQNEARFRKTNPALTIESREVGENSMVTISAHLDERLGRLYAIANMVLAAELETFYDMTMMSPEECPACFYGYQA